MNLHTINLNKREQDLFIYSFKNTFVKPNKSFIFSLKSDPYFIPVISKQTGHTSNEEFEDYLSIKTEKIVLKKWAINLPCAWETVYVPGSFRDTVIILMAASMANSMIFECAKTRNSFEPPDYVVMKDSIKMYFEKPYSLTAERDKWLKHLGSGKIGFLCAIIWIGWSKV